MNRFRRAAPTLLSLAAGAAAGLAHPPFGFLPGLFGFAVVLHLLDHTNPDRPLRSAFLRGWAAGFAYFLVGTWWVGEAFLVDIQAHGWQAPFAVALLPAGIGLFWGLAALAYRRFAPSHPGRILFFAAIWSIAEWLRGHVLTGFPWDLPGEAWRAGSAMSQAASILGAYGLTFITVAIAAAPAVLRGPESRRVRIVVVSIAVVVLVAIWGGGAWRLSLPAPADTAHVVRVVQANVTEKAKLDPAAFPEIFGRYLKLTAGPAKGRRPDTVIWSESALPYPADELLAPATWTRPAIAAALAPGQTLFMGAYRVAGTPEHPVYFNSLVALKRGPSDLAVTALYDKHRLVPFGEYLPLESWLAPLGLKKLAGVGEGFSSGPAPRPIAPEGVPRVQPLICYESLFPEFTTGISGRPAWIVNISNDSWFGRTSGPWQNLNLASYRAIEAGLPLVRATPTGVSAIIDAYGRTRARLGLGVEGVIDGPLPAALEPTFYSRLGDLSCGLLCLAGLASGWHGRFPRKTFKSSMA